MTFFTNSRYRRQVRYTVEVDGQRKTAISWREPQLNSFQTRLPDLKAIPGADTYDEIAIREYGDANLYWAVADASDALFPLDLRSGDSVKIPPSGIVDALK